MPEAAAKPIRVLIVDDSASVRTTLSEIISADPDLEVMATASDPYVAVERIRSEVPDVIFLDVEMPRMDGLTLPAQADVAAADSGGHLLLAAEAGSDTLMQLLEAGAVDVVTKPRVDTAQFLLESSMRICDAAKAAAHAKLRGIKKAAPQLRVEAKLTADALIPALSAARSAALKLNMPLTEPIIAIGASTGGTEALREVLEALPASTPGIVIVQHMPEKFTNAFARRLDTLCAMTIKEAEHGDQVMQGRVLIAPGNQHMALRRTGSRYTVEILDGPHVSRHRPSVDVLFRSVAQAPAATPWESS